MYSGGTTQGNLVKKLNFTYFFMKEGNLLASLYLVILRYFSINNEIFGNQKSAFFDKFCIFFLKN